MTLAKAIPLAMVVCLAACAPNPATLQGYGREMALKNQEIDRLDLEIHDLRKRAIDSTISQAIDSLLRRRDRAEADLIDLKRSADRPAEEYRSNTRTFWTPDAPDPKKYPIK